MLGKEKYYRDEQELVRRTMWFSCVVYQHLNTVIPSLQYQLYWDEEKTERHMQETIAYVSCILLEQLADDLMERHGWGDEEYYLCMDCRICLAIHFDELLGYKKHNIEVFSSLFDKYWTPDDYNTEAYDVFWGIPKDKEADSLEEAYQQLHDTINESQEKIGKKYNIHRLYTFRVSTIYNIPDPYHHLAIWSRRCSGLVLPLYQEMFVNLSSRKVVQNLRRMLPFSAT